MKLADSRLQRISNSFLEFKEMKYREGSECYCRLGSLWKSYKVWLVNSGYRLKHLAQKEFVVFLKTAMSYQIVTIRGVRWVQGVCANFTKSKLIDFTKTVGEVLFDRYGRAKGQTSKRLLETPYDFRRRDQTDDYSDVLINTGNLDADIQTTISQIQALRKHKSFNF